MGNGNYYRSHLWDTQAAAARETCDAHRPAVRCPGEHLLPGNRPTVGSDLGTSLTSCVTLGKLHNLSGSSES